MRHILLLILFACAITFIFQADLIAADGDPDPHFMTGNGFNGEVLDIALLPDGKLIVAGKFTAIVGVPLGRIGRMETNGNVDLTYSPGTGANGDINSIKLLPDGKLIIGGSFTSYNGIAINRLARLNPDGSLDTTFNVGTGPSFTVNKIIILLGNQIMVAGKFTSFNGFVTHDVARLLADGSVDESFAVPLNALSTNGPIKDLEVQSDGKVLIGGFFFTDKIEAIKNFARLNSDGTLDTSFQVKIDSFINNPVTSIYVRLDGKILVGGNFHMVSGVARSNIVLLGSDGTVDNSFVATNVNSVNDMKIDGNGKLMIVGSVNLPPETTIARLNSDGSTDTSFTTAEPRFPYSTNAFVFTPDDKIIAGGSFFRNIIPLPSATGVGVRKFDSDGSRDNTYLTRTGATVAFSKLIIQSTGKIAFRSNGTVGGLERIGLARLNPNGTVDENYAPALVGTAIAAQSDGSVIVGGIQEPGFHYIRKANPDGSIDPAYSVQVISPINPFGQAITDMDGQPDGKIVAVGDFHTVGGVARKSLVRLNSDGSVDESFSSNIVTGEADIRRISLLPNGKMWVSGRFQDTTLASNVYRLNSNGIAETFTQTNSTVDHFAPLNNGKVFICGAFSLVSQIPATYVARLNQDGTLDTSFTSPTITGNSINIRTCYAQADGKVIVGGSFATVNGVSRNSIVRLNSDGTLDNSFSPEINFSSTVWSIARQPDGKLLIAGDFGTVNGISKRGIARLFLTDRSSPFDFDGDGKTDLSIFRPAPGEWWYLRSSDNGDRAFQFGQSTNKLVAADYTGDGKTDIAFYRPASGEWFVLRSEDSSFYAFPFGNSTDIPVPADFDGDGKADPAVFRPLTATWFIQRSSDNGTTITNFGASGDRPVPADYDGDGKTDLAIFRPSDGSWWLDRSTAGLAVLIFGNSNDKTVPADYTGDGKADVAFFRSQTNDWFILRSEDFSFYSARFGAAGDIPTPGDYDGDGVSDLAIFRPSQNTWYLQRSTSGFTAIGFGAANDIPIPFSYVR